MSRVYDIAIAGGGLGGASYAKSMAERGANVLVIEHERQFKDRVRGEIVVPWGHAEAYASGVAGCLGEALGTRSGGWTFMPLLSGWFIVKSPPPHLSDSLVWRSIIPPCKSRY